MNYGSPSFADNMTTLFSDLNSGPGVITSAVTVGKHDVEIRARNEAWCGPMPTTGASRISVGRQYVAWRDCVNQTIKSKSKSKGIPTWVLVAGAGALLALVLR